ncbi:hypothetical protein F7725_011016 [Dissostichus mawsoni]|uniref:Uncharacterized protein n=1 Tax=Dissostichus mawsoni TaxID=36200 RepID=A0A7J5Z7S3_DISMA|nr:hypothetical protein F7725_011016 [Dissostichus mawsoni]
MERWINRAIHGTSSTNTSSTASSSSSSTRSGGSGAAGGRLADVLAQHVHISAHQHHLRHHHHHHHRHKTGSKGLTVFVSPGDSFVPDIITKCLFVLLLLLLCNHWNLWRHMELL